MPVFPGPDDRVEVGPAKRALDVALSLALLVLTSPVSLVIAAGEAIDSMLSAEDRGPVVYRETRVSQGVPFTLYKFRILKVRAIVEQIGEQGLAPKTVENRPENVTAMGRFLKKTGLDELPQFFNILRGDMSFVGPRPKPVTEYEAEVAKGVWRRKVIRAGLTGPAQLLKGTVRTAEDDLAADLAYIAEARDASQWRRLRTDLVVLWRTLRLMLKMTGE